MRKNTIHTLQSLMNRCVEEGDCMLWSGYCHNGVPQVNHDGKITSVRRLVLHLQGKEAKAFTASRCGNPKCIAPAHIVSRSPAGHIKSMSKKAHVGDAAVRHHIAIQTWRRANPIKLDEERAALIRSDDRPTREIALEHDISRGMVNRIKREESWRDNTNPFFALAQRANV